MKGPGIAQRVAAIAGCIFLVTAPLGDARSENPGGGSALQQLAEQARIAEVLSSLNDRPMPEISILRNVRVVDPVEGAVTPPQSIVVSNGAIFWIGDRGPNLRSRAPRSSRATDAMPRPG